MNQIFVSQDDNNKTITAKLDDVITISLRENATTGYRWNSEGVDEKIIHMEESKYSVPSDSAIGGGGTRTFEFRPRSLGTAKMHLSLKREWEKDMAPIDQFVIFIQII